MRSTLAAAEDCEPELDPCFFADYPAPATPEKSLLVAMIEMAIRDLRRKAEREDAVRWLTGKTADMEELSFEEVCGLLGIDRAELLRRVGLEPFNAAAEGQGDL